MIRRLVLAPARSAINHQKPAVRLLSSAKTETYTERQAKKGRPVSPHVTIYKFPLAALSSITNRVTGAVLFGGLSAIGGLNLIDVDVYALTGILGSIPFLGTVTKFGVAFPLVFHYGGGVRHLLWDRNPELLENEKVEQASKILIGGSAVVSAAIALL